MTTGTLAFSRVRCGYPSFSCLSNADGFRKGNGGDGGWQHANKPCRTDECCSTLHIYMPGSQLPSRAEQLGALDGSFADFRPFTQRLNDAIAFVLRQTDDLSFGPLENGRRVFWSLTIHPTNTDTQTHPSKRRKNIWELCACAYVWLDRSQAWTAAVLHLLQVCDEHCKASLCHYCAAMLLGN